MEFIPHVRKSFHVEAIEITPENIEEVAALVGKYRINEENQTPYISLDRRIVPNVGRAYVGWWLTRLGDNYRCYAPKIFKEQFVAEDEQEVHNVFSTPVDTAVTAVTTQ